MKLPIFLIVALFAIQAHSSNSWPQKKRQLHGDIHAISYSKNGKQTVKVAFLDADSNLRIAPSGKPSANAADDVQVLPCVGSRLQQLKELGYLIAIVSNQGGISSNKVTYEVANLALQETMKQSIERNAGAFFHWYDFAEDYTSFLGNDEKLNTFRKPGKGMALALQAALNELNITIDKENSFIVGDSLFKKKHKELKPNGEKGIQFSNSDRCFAQNYGIRYFDPADFFGWNSKELFNTQFFDNKKNGTNIDFYLSYPKESQQGGKIESLFCKKLTSYKKYSSYIENDTPTLDWIAGYQCHSGICSTAYYGKTLCPKLN